ncbi:MAG: nucleotidyltransferase domain-containing protein [Rhizobiales bacterium]|nr:nucleotidyltransferase domain-containing protein [Hyphomicrobiales bacterium]
MDVRNLLDGAHSKPVGPFRDEQSAIAFLRDRLVAELKPESIWLFGSRARGDARPDSDFDMLVVLRDGLSDEEYSHYAVARPVVACGLGCDIVPTSWSTFVGEKDVKGSFVNAILSEGREIYRTRALRSQTAR